MHKMSIRQRLLATVVIATAFLLLLTSVNFYTHSESTASISKVKDHTVAPLLAAKNIDADVREIRFRIAGVLLGQLPAVGSRNHLTETRAKIPKDWEAFKSAYRPEEASEQAKELLAKIEAGISALPTVLSKLDTAYNNDDRKMLTAILEDEWPEINAKLSKPLAQLIPELSASMDRDFAATKTRGDRTNLMALTAAGISIAALLLTVLPLIASIGKAISDFQRSLHRVADGDFTAELDLSRKDELGDMARSLAGTLKNLRSLVRSVIETSDSVATAANQMASELSSVIQQSSECQHHIDRVADSVQEMSQATEQISSGSASAASASEEARSRASAGDSSMGGSIEATLRIETAVNESSSIIQELSTAADRISQITNTIKEIADQTNLLALNAAIEAARAGEQGRGFAVVADEVRKLAERTTISTSDISSMIESIRSKTDLAVSSMTHVKNEMSEGKQYTLRTREAFDGIISAAEEVRKMARQIAEATQSQLDVSTRTTRDVENALGISASSSQSLTGLSNMSATLTRMAQQMQQQVSHFRV
jgi:methyl-accepting chemotaxis protein